MVLRIIVGKKKKIPELSIFNLPQIKNRKWDLYYAGIIALNDKRLSELNELQERMVACFSSSERYVNKEYIQFALSSWQFPLVFLDFETINPAIPRYDHCHPYDHVPFQFSVHIWGSPDKESKHTAFLHDETSDPRPTLIPALLNACGEQGSIIAYFGKFEADRIQALADYSPENQTALMKLIDRIVDPLPIIRDAVYDNAFAGRFSLKSVAPALLGKNYSYEGMLVANGSDAQRAFAELIAHNTPPERKAALKQAMLDYCEKDTFVMLELVKWLYSST